MSTLLVENLKGPTSGSNADTVIIPSGQTLDTSAATFKPAGKQIVQQTFYHGTDTFTSSGSAWVATPVASSITPVYSDSIIMCVATCAVWRSSYSGYFGVKVVNTGGNTSTPAVWGDGYLNGASIAWDTPYVFDYVAGSTSSITSTFYIHPNGGGSWFPNNSPTFGATNRWTMLFMEVRP
mgnify:CR=1 FL=1